MNVQLSPFLGKKKCIQHLPRNLPSLSEQNGIHVYYPTPPHCSMLQEVVLPTL